MEVLRTQRLSLFPCSPADCEDFINLELDPEVMRFLNGGYAVDHSQHNRDATFLMPRGTEDYVWTARRTANRDFVGWFCLWPESEKVAELGYRLCRLEWGQGLAAEGAAALVNWGFKSGRYDRVFASTMAVNHASRRVMEKIGMKFAQATKVEGANTIAGGEEGEVQYDLLRSNWESAPDFYVRISREYGTDVDLDALIREDRK